jgi:hypothetical protein
MSHLINEWDITRGRMAWAYAYRQQWDLALFHAALIFDTSWQTSVLTLLVQAHGQHQEKSSALKSRQQRTRSGWLREG